MIINSDTKIASILKHMPLALDAIVAVSPKFEKLRNPVLRKLMAGRTSLSMASKMGGCSVDAIFEKLQPLGFEIDRGTAPFVDETTPLPPFLHSMDPGSIVHLDVRPVIESGNDPLKLIMEQISSIQRGGVLKILTGFEPAPLRFLLGKQGIDSHAVVVDDTLVETYFFKKEAVANTSTRLVTDDWDDILQRHRDKIKTIEVRHLEMPLPMLTILGELDKLAQEEALFIYHKRVPLFLLPELAMRNFDYRLKEITGNEVHLIIFRTNASGQ